MAGLPGVKVGPLDPDTTSDFGQVAAKNSARQLIRLHKQMHPPQLLAALVRPRDDARSKAVLDHLDEVADYVGTLSHPNGDPMLPDGAWINGASVRGDKATGQVLTFTYALKSGRVGTWFAPYRREDLPEAFDAGEQFTRVHEMRERGMVALDSEGTHTQILERHNRDLVREVEALRANAEGRGDGAEVPDTGAAAATDTRNSVNLATENERLGRENVEMRDRLNKLEAIVASIAGGVPTDGVGETIPGGDENAGLAGGDTSIAAQDPPFPEYEGMRADDAVKYLKDPARTDEERAAVLKYEQTHANRKSVVGAAEESLGTGS